MNTPNKPTDALIAQVFQCEDTAKRAEVYEHAAWACIALGHKQNAAGQRKQATLRFDEAKRNMKLAEEFRMRIN